MIITTYYVNFPIDRVKFYHKMLYKNRTQIVNHTLYHSYVYLFASELKLFLFEIIIYQPICDLLHLGKMKLVLFSTSGDLFPVFNVVEKLIKLLSCLKTLTVKPQ